MDTKIKKVSEVADWIKSLPIEPHEKDINIPFYNPVKLFGWEGSKFIILKETLSLFPEHTTYAEPFFGSGIVFFNKKKVTRNYINDKSDLIYDIFSCLQEDGNELRKWLRNAVVTDKLFRTEAKTRVERVGKAIIELSLSRYFSKQGVRFFEPRGEFQFKRNIVKAIKLLDGVVFYNSDAKVFVDKISRAKGSKIFYYCDIPYIGTRQKKYKSYNVSDFVDLVYFISKKAKRGVKRELYPLFMVSASYYSELVEVAREMGLNVYKIKEFTKHTRRNNRIEIAITNYDANWVDFERI